MQQGRKHRLFFGIYIVLIVSRYKHDLSGHRQTCTLL
jgi:hypothetical protein